MFFNKDAFAICELGMIGKPTLITYNSHFVFHLDLLMYGFEVIVDGNTLFDSCPEFSRPDHGSILNLKLIMDANAALEPKS